MVVIACAICPPVQLSAVASVYFFSSSFFPNTFSIASSQSVTMSVPSI